MMSTHSPSSRGSPNPPGSSSPHSKHSRQHRGTVIIEQSLLSVQSPDSAEQNDDATHHRKSTGSLSHSGESGPKQLLSTLQRKSTGSPNHHSDYRDSSGTHQASPESFSHPILSPPASFHSTDHRYSTDSLTQISPPDSIRSSVSSLVDTASSVSNLAIVTSTEDRLLEELKRQIAHGALRIQQLEQQVEGIPVLTVKVDELEKERGKLANDLLDSQEIVQSMKQRLSLLHEQNNQLVKLTHASSSGSSELLRNRNALVASLAQIKKLQERVDTIPSLKTQLRGLMEENTQLKEQESLLSKQFPSQLPEGVTRVSYQKLSEENSKLVETNQKLTSDNKAASERLSSMSSSFENLKKRMDKFESTRSIVVPLQQRIKRLEKEKDELYQEYIDVKFNQHPAVDIDTAHLLNEATSLKKRNSHLQAKLEQVTIDSRQEKEKLVLKLFELESLNVNSQKYELERQILEVEETKGKSTPPSETRKTSTPTFNHSKSRHDSIEDEMSNLPAESKIQMLKLQQLKVHSEQSRGMVQSLLFERDELEKRVEELTTSSDRKAIDDLERSVEEKEYKLQIARESITKLEKELQLVSSSSSEHSSILATNKDLADEVERLREVQKNYDELVATQRQARQYLEEHDTLVHSLQKAKDDKHKAERRYKEGKSRLRSLAKELSSSVELLKNYQSQCMKLQEQVDEKTKELKSVRNVSASYKAKLEVAEAESPPSEDNLDGVGAKDDHDLKASYDKVCKERDGLQQTIDSLSKTISEQQTQLWKVKAEMKELEESRLNEDKVQSLTQEKTSLSKQLEEQSTKLSETAHDLDTVKRKLEAEKMSVESVQVQLEKSQTECTQLQTDCKQKLEESVVLRGELDQAKVTIVELTKSKADFEVEMNKLKEDSVSEQKLRSSSENEKAKLKQDLKSSRDSCDGLKKQLVEKEKSIEDESTSRKQLDSELSELKTKTIPELNSQITSLSKEKDKLSAGQKSSSEEAKRLEKALAAKTKELSTKVSEEATKSSKLLSSSKGTVKALKQDLDKSKTEYEKLESTHKEVKKSLAEHEAALTKQSHENESLSQKLEQTKSLENELQVLRKSRDSLEAELKQLHQSTQSTHTQKMELEATASHRDSEHRKALSEQTKHVHELKKSNSTLTDEIEGYKGTIRSLQRHVEEAETREVEHERLKQNFKQLEKALGHSSHDNKALFGILQQTLKELPGYSSEASRSLQDENLRLEEQVSVLSQWNDKQRNEIETLERGLEKLEEEKEQLLVDIMAKENHSQENAQLKRELKEVEMEVGMLRRQARSDVQEELQVKMETQSQLLAVFNQHNTSLQRQVSDLQSHVQTLGGTLDRDKPVSPPPMPDVALSIPREENRQRTVPDLERENYILKERIGTMEKELVKLQGVSSQFRRRSSSLRAMFSVPVGPINEELQVNVPPELLLPCSLLSDYINEHGNIQGSVAEDWLEAIKSEWFACMAQRTLTPACAQCYISTMSRLSNRLMEIVVNVQDEKGNTALHYAVANGNFPVVSQFVRLRCCNTCLMNKAGYSPLMLAAACSVEVGDHKDVIGHLIDRGGINTIAAKDQRTALMLAACSGSLELVVHFMEKGAEVNLKDKDGSTALMFAAQSGHMGIVNTLLSSPHCELSIKDNDGLTALDIAKEAGFSEIAGLLTRHSKNKFKR